jgi:hypothetical protein
MFLPTAFNLWDQSLAKLFSALALPFIAGTQYFVERIELEGTHELAMRRAYRKPLAVLSIAVPVAMDFGLGPRLLELNTAQHFSGVQQIDKRAQRSSKSTENQHFFAPLSFLLDGFDRSLDRRMIEKRFTTLIESLTDDIQPPFRTLLAFDIGGVPGFFLRFVRGIRPVELFLPMVVIDTLDLVEKGRDSVAVS